MSVSLVNRTNSGTLSSAGQLYTLSRKQNKLWTLSRQQANSGHSVVSRRNSGYSLVSRTNSGHSLVSWVNSGQSLMSAGQTMYSHSSLGDNSGHTLMPEEPTMDTSCQQGKLCTLSHVSPTTFAECQSILHLDFTE